MKKTFIQLIYPALYLATVLVADSLTPLGTITPFFLVVGLLIMSVTLPPRVMIPWAVIYTGTVCTIFLDPKLFLLFSGHPYYDQYVIPILRASTYIVVGVVFSYLCVVLHRLKGTEEELNTILENLPWPIITSDHNGKILYWNESAEVLLPKLTQNKLASSYFDLLAPPDRQGRTIASYINRFEQNQNREPLELSLSGGRRIVGHTRLMHYGSRSVLLTTLAEPDDLPTILPITESDV